MTLRKRPCFRWALATWLLPRSSKALTPETENNNSYKTKLCVPKALTPETENNNNYKTELCVPKALTPETKNQNKTKTTMGHGYWRICSKSPKFDSTTRKCGSFEN